MTVATADVEQGAKVCGANRKENRGPCQRPAGWGTPHLGTGACKLHGGCTPTHVIAGQRELAQRIADEWGIPREIDPVQALMEELHRTAGMVSFYETQVIEAERITHETMFGEVPTVWVKLLAEERRHLQDVARDCIKAGIEERRVRIAEDQGKLIATVIRGILADLGVADRRRFRGWCGGTCRLLLVNK